MMGWKLICPLRWDFMYEKILQLHPRHPEMHLEAAVVQFLCFYEKLSFYAYRLCYQNSFTNLLVPAAILLGIQIPHGAERLPRKMSSCLFT